MADTAASDKVYIFDTTLRDGEQSPGCTMNEREKIRVARQLDALGVDSIEAGFPAASEGDFASVRALAQVVEHARVVGLCRTMPEDISRAWDAVKEAKHPGIHTFIATSPLHMKHKLGKAPAQVMEMACQAVRQAVSLSPVVEFSAEDASRSEWDFLAQICAMVIDCGARVINIPDTVGYAQPDEFAQLITYLLREVPNAGEAVFSVHCHNDLGMAVANTMAAIRAGARQAEVTLSGIGERAGNAALEEVVMNINTRPAWYAVHTTVKTELLYPANRLLSRILGRPLAPTKAIVGDNAFAHESGIHQDGMLKNPQTYEIMTPESVGRTGTQMVMGKHSGRHAIAEKTKELGFHLTEEEIVLVVKAIKQLAENKKDIFDEDVEAIVFGEVFRVPDRYCLKHLHVQAGTLAVPSTAVVVMEVEGQEKKLATFGVGSVDAVFNAIKEIIGRSPHLEHFLVSAVTGGADAQAEVTVKLSEKNQTAMGRGADLDVIVASAKAYLNALNRLAKKREER